MELKNIKDILPYEKNAKKHPKKQVEQVAASIKEFGFNQPIVVDKDNVLIVGHGRLEAAKLLGLKEVPTVTVDLTEEQAKSYRLADNKLNESEWDMNLVIEELKGLSPEMLDLSGFEKDLIIEADEKDDEVPEAPEEPKSKLGDLYELGSHRVLCGDSTDKASVDLLMNGDKADMVFTDPPYGMDLDADFADIHTSRDTTALGGGKQRSHTNYEKVIGDSGDFDFSCIATICDMADEVFLWGADYYIDSVPNSGKGGSWIVWNKKPKGDMGKAIGNQFEICWSKQKHKRIVIDYTYSGACGMKPNDGNRVHPTQKPIDLIAQMFERWGKDKQNIIDLFLGSGSTLIACEQTDRTCYGMELDPKYVDVIVQRYVDYTGDTNIKINGKEIIWNKTPQK